MKTEKKDLQNDQLDQLGGTDQIEQLAADLAVEENRDRVTNVHREKALRQMEEMATPPQNAQEEAEKANPHGSESPHQG
ncbi:hypothetical protein SAMN02745166_00875 [Prosthecobacter debontii]|uniref:Uncharacterized protein n=1 Tax=Prosthecobacter debontii TaxID=48467 RepID=A0A1T4WZ91_9BACT|nr:hypothetical protein [Prosthecobacter debontii]SKA82185.1 hypothetical protein SAMN02745166_00875 [Prosthecobacter debontii]